MIFPESPRPEPGGNSNSKDRTLPDQLEQLLVTLAQRQAELEKLLATIHEMLDQAADNNDSSD